MHALLLDQVLHGIVACHRQLVLLPVEAVHQVERDLGFEIGDFQLVGVVPEKVKGLRALVRIQEENGGKMRETSIRNTYPIDSKGSRGSS